MVEQSVLVEQLGSAATNQMVARLQRFTFIPDAILGELATAALEEKWGIGNFALKAYLAAQVPWSVEQGRFTQGRDQWYVTAGHLQTRYGTPLYLIFEPNRNPGRQPWCLVAAGSYVSAPELPIPPDIPEPPEIPKGAEIVMLHDHILVDHPERIPFLVQTPRVAQMCAIAGAIQWSINRGLHFGYWYFGRMQYLVPLYLQRREDITEAPDAVAPVQVSGTSLMVRTVLAPEMPYPKARVAVRRHDQLPRWLLAAWAEYASTATEQAIEDPEEASEVRP